MTTILSTCSIDLCETKLTGHDARGWCGKHYTRWRKHGDPEYVPTMKPQYFGWHEAFIRIGWTVADNGCCIWNGDNDSHGYGMLALVSNKQTKKRLVHRISFEYHHGYLTPGLDVCHSCDTPMCVGEKCLFEGTRKRNMEDAHNKGRLYRVCKETGVTLNKVQRDEIISLYAPYKVKAGYLANKYNVTTAYINSIINASRMGVGVNDNHS